MIGDAPLNPSIILLSDKLWALTNLHTCIMVLLDVDEMNYSSSMYFFRNLCRGYNLLTHILGEEPTDAPTSSDPPPKTTECDNKRSRSIALKENLRSMKLGYLSIDAYFCKIEYIATILSSLGSPVSNDDVMHLKSRAQVTYVDSSSSSPTVLLANSNARRATPSSKSAPRSNGSSSNNLT
ncbi:hypothetical protein Tco_1167829 [Tanacetum coccineum]